MQSDDAVKALGKVDIRVAMDQFRSDAASGASFARDVRGILRSEGHKISHETLRMADLCVHLSGECSCFLTTQRMSKDAFLLEVRVDHSHLPR